MSRRRPDPVERKIAGKTFRLRARYAGRDSARAEATRVRGVPENRAFDAVCAARVMRSTAVPGCWALYVEVTR